MRYELGREAYALLSNMKFPVNSWNVTFVREWWPHMTFSSVMRCRNYCLRLSRSEGLDERKLLINMRSPIYGEVVLREVPADWWTFEEIVREEVYKSVLSHLVQCDTVIDLGAHIGLASLYFATQYPASRLFAVEPNPANYMLLLINAAALVHSGRCRTLNAAVWQCTGTLAAKPLPSPGRYNAFSVEEPLPGGPSPTFVNGMPMEEIVAASGFRTVDILKIDVEGAEVQLFRGSLDWLDRVRALLIEFHGESRQESNFDAIMRRHSFRICEENRHTLLALRA